MPAPAWTASDATTITLRGGRSVVSFGGCNYLGLANHPEVIGAIVQGLHVYGVSSTASRETTGNAEPHELLEAELATFLGTESALLVPDGYLANIVACQGLARAGITHALLDARTHVSQTDAARTAGLRTHTFAHGSAEALASALHTIRPNNAVVMTDGVFTADGEPAAVSGLLAALGPGDRLLIDDCHGLGVRGPGGRGSAAEHGASDQRLVITSSLAKALGCAGGVVAGSAGFIAVCHAASGYVCTTPIAPAMAQGSRAALRVLNREPERLERLRHNAEMLRRGLRELGLLRTSEHWQSPIVAFTLQNRSDMPGIAERLLNDGYRVPLISYPGGPASDYFRVSVSSEHNESQIKGVLGALNASLGRLSDREPARETVLVESED